MNVHLGSMHAESWGRDSKHLGFVLRRYHFVARMLRGVGRVLEIGCGDTTGARLVKPHVGFLLGVDRDEYPGDPSIPVKQHDILLGPVPGMYGEWDAVYALDVMEHISPDQENLFLSNITTTLASHGCLIIGMPSKESQSYASELSRLHHVNCKTGPELYETMSRYFHAVFMFGINDYALHDGFDDMCHYRISIGVGKR